MIQKNNLHSLWPIKKRKMRKKRLLRPPRRMPIRHLIACSTLASYSSPFSFYSPSLISASANISSKSRSIYLALASFAKKSIRAYKSRSAHNSDYKESTIAIYNVSKKSMKFIKNTPKYYWRTLIENSTLLNHIKQKQIIFFTFIL